MVNRNAFAILATGAVTVAVALGSSMTGCQSDNPGAGGSVGTGGSTTSGTGGTAATGGSGTGGTTTTPTASVDATIKDITTGKVGQKINVKVKGAVAMSQKWLVSQSKSSGSCLWGVFVSDPGLTETAPNTGILALSYGTPAVIPDGGTKAFCPILGKEPAGDSFPDDVKPGDVLDIVGTSDYFIQNACGTPPDGGLPADAGPDSSVAQFQISKVSSATKTGTATPPKPHVLTDAEVASLASPSDKTFHDQWGGVKVTIQNVTSAGTAVTDMYGVITLDPSGLKLPDNVYYQGYLKGGDACHSGPVYPGPTQTFTAISGFSYLNFCTWELLSASKCTDLAPPSSDCVQGTGTPSATQCFYQ